MKRTHLLAELLVPASILLFIVWIGGGCGGDNYGKSEFEDVATTPGPPLLAVPPPAPTLQFCPANDIANQLPASCCDSNGTQTKFIDECGSNPGGTTTNGTITQAATTASHVSQAIANVDALANPGSTVISLADPNAGPAPVAALATAGNITAGSGAAKNGTAVTRAQPSSTPAPGAFVAAKPGAGAGGLAGTPAAGFGALSPTQVDSAVKTLSPDGAGAGAAADAGGQYAAAGAAAGDGGSFQENSMSEHDVGGSVSHASFGKDGKAEAASGPAKMGAKAPAEPTYGHADNDGILANNETLFKRIHDKYTEKNRYWASLPPIPESAPEKVDDKSAKKMLDLDSIK